MKSVLISMMAMGASYLLEACRANVGIAGAALPTRRLGSYGRRVVAYKAVPWG